MKHDNQYIPESGFDKFCLVVMFIVLFPFLFPYYLFREVIAESGQSRVRDIEMDSRSDDWPVADDGELASDWTWQVIEIIAVTTMLIVCIEAGWFTGVRVGHLLLLLR